MRGGYRAERDHSRIAARDGERFGLVRATMWDLSTLYNLHDELNHTDDTTLVSLSDIFLSCPGTSRV